MRTIRLLDLCCGAGGCAMGYKLAADDLGIQIEIIGIDILEQKNYPFKFIKDDALSFLIKYGQGFTHIHASPPCQEYSASRRAVRNKNREYRSNLTVIRQTMYQIKIPGVIENVPGSPLVQDIILTGKMFGLPIIRKRIFETINWFTLKPSVPLVRRGACNRGEIISVFGNGTMNRRDGGGEIQIPGSTVLEKRKFAMGINWMNNKEISQAIPPAYTHYIGQEFLTR